MVSQSVSQSVSRLTVLHDDLAVHRQPLTRAVLYTTSA